MNNMILVVNAGSSSIKFSLFAEDVPGLPLRLRGQVEGLYSEAHFEAVDSDGARVADHRWAAGVALGHDRAIAFLTDFLRQYLDYHRLIAVGHRVVHGGERYLAPVQMSPERLGDLEELIPLAPLHQPHNLRPIRHLLKAMPDISQVACFDTSFHLTIPAERQAYALPGSITEHGVRRYGFHGLSYEYIASQLPHVDQRAAEGRTVVLHLGSGASACALEACKSVATSMGFSALGGLPMGTRSGDLDPGVLLYLVQQLKMDAKSIESLLYRESGLLGVSGLSSDMRTLLASSDPKACLAVNVFVDAVNRQIGAMAATMGGLDALVFTAGIGENAASVRERVCRDARWLGVELDPAANSRHELRISGPSSRVSVWAIPTNEELMIARHTLALERAACALGQP